MGPPTSFAPTLFHFIGSLCVEMLCSQTKHKSLEIMGLFKFTFGSLFCLFSVFTYICLFTSQIPLHHIQSLSQHRIPGIPGPIAKVLVECLAGPRQTCQAHLRMTLEYGDTITKMLIPIWVVKFYPSIYAICTYIITFLSQKLKIILFSLSHVRQMHFKGHLKLLVPLFNHFGLRYYKMRKFYCLFCFLFSRDAGNYNLSGKYGCVYHKSKIVSLNMWGNMT